MKIISKKEALSQGLKTYFTGKLCKHGHASVRYATNGKCCECVSEKNKEKYWKDPGKYREKRKSQYIERTEKEKEYRDKYNRENKDLIRKIRRDRYMKDPEKEKEKVNEWRRNNPVRVKEQQKCWREKNPNYQQQWREKNRDRSNWYTKKWIKNNKEKRKQIDKDYSKKNPTGKFIRNSLKRILNNWNGGRDDMEKLHGYTFEQLKQRLECQFKDGISWDNYGEWHIDHKKPVARFIDQGVTDPVIINSLSNLQPLWARENLSKHAKFNL